MSTTQSAKWTRLPIRTRPHRNPLAQNDDVHPDCPAAFQARLPEYFPGMPNPHVEFVDVGCAFGGMLFQLSAVFPEVCMLGLEIRSKVVAFAQEKADALRIESDEDAASAAAAAHGAAVATGAAPSATVQHHYRNVWFEQLNVMKFGSNCFVKGQLSRLFFCYPDPHWKRKNIRRRIISPGLVHEYAYWLKVGGLLYTVSDVEELETWMVDCLDGCPLFRRLTDDELATAEHQRVLCIVIDSSEDAQRTERKGGKKNYAVHMRV